MHAAREKSSSGTGLPFGSLNRRAVHGIAAGLGASVISLTAMGLEAPVSSNTAALELQEVVITGSMIKRPSAETAEAVTIVKMDAFKDLGVTTVEQALALVTSNNATITTASNVEAFNGGAS